MKENVVATQNAQIGESIENFNGNAKVVKSNPYTEQLFMLETALDNECISHQDGDEYYKEEEDGKTYVQFYVEFNHKCESIMVVVEPEKVTVSLSHAKMGGCNTEPMYEQIPNIEYGFEPEGLVQIVNESIEKMASVYKALGIR